jgi:hypothetical protein
MSTRRASRILLQSGTLAVMLLGMATALATVTPHEVIGGNGFQTLPFANSENIVWTSNSSAHPKHYNAYARPRSGGSAVRINADGTEGFTGGFDPTTNTVIYQQIENGSSDLYWYDLDTSTRSVVTGVNSKRWEWSPRVSTSYILFERDYRKSGTWYTSIYLFDRGTSTTLLLGTWAEHKYYVRTGSVGETYATWTVCTSKRCFAHLHTIATQTTQRIPTKNKRLQYAPAVDEANTSVYFVRSGAACGATVRILRLPADDLSAAPTKIVALPTGIYAGDTMSLAPNTDGVDQDLLFERATCDPFTSDAYQADAVNTVPDA